MADLNRILEGQLQDASASNTESYTLVQSDFQQGTNDVLLTATLRINEAFADDAGWTLELLDASNTVLATLNASSVTGFADNGMMVLQTTVPNNGAVVKTRVSSESGTTFDDAAYQLSLETTGLLEEGVVARLVDGVAVEANASSDSDTDNFGFQLSAGETGSATVTFSAAGTLTVTGSNVVGGDNTPITTTSVTADEALTLNFNGTTSTFVNLRFEADATGDYTVQLQDSSDRVVEPVSIISGDVIANDSRQQLVTQSDSGLQFKLDDDGEALLGQLFQTNLDGSGTLSISSSAAISATNGEGQTRAISTDSGTPTEFSLDELSDWSISGADLPAGATGLTFTAFVQADSAVTDADQIKLISSGVIQAQLVQDANGVSFELTDSDGNAITELAEGSSGTLTATLDSATSENVTIFLNNYGDDLSFGSGSDSNGTLTITAGQTSGSISVTAKANDGDVETSEDVGIQAQVTAGLEDLVVPTIDLTVTETVPAFSLTQSSQESIVGSDDLVSYELTLDNAGDFSNDAVSIALSVPDGFFVGDSSASATTGSATVTLGGTSTSVTVYAKASTSAISSATLSGAITGTVTVDSQTVNVSLPTMSVFRIQSSAEATSSNTFDGTSGNDTFEASQANETFSGGAGNDALTLTNDNQLAGTFDGGAGTDTVTLTGNRDTYTAAVSGQTTTLTLGDNTLSLLGVETVSFADESDVAIADLNPNQNNAPVWTTVPNQVIDPGSSSAITIDLNSYVTDADDDAITITIADLPSWLSLSDGGILTSSTAPSNDTQVTLTVQADDGEDTTSTTFNINVTDEVVPTLDTVKSGEAVTLDVSTITAAYGVSESDLTIEWQTSSDGMTWSADTSASGTSATFTAGNSATFVRAQVSAQGQSAVNTEAQLVKDGDNIVRGTFDGIEGGISATAYDLTGSLIDSSDNTTAITNFGNEPGSVSLTTIPTGTFGLTLNASSDVTPDIGINDVISTLRAIVGLDTLTSKQTIAADMNDNGEVGISDVIGMLRQIVGLDDSDGFVGAAEQSDGSYSTDLTSADVDSVVWIGRGDLDSSLDLDLL